MASAGENAQMRLSQAGRQALAHAEAVRHVYYNDQGGNCTYGVGTLVHYGPCTAAEAASPVTDAMINASLTSSIRDAERLVRRTVTGHALTQRQFDAAVSLVYNTGLRGARALRPANQGDMDAVARNMQAIVYVCRHDARTGRVVPGSCRVSNGLVARRAREAAPFSGGRP